MRCLRNSVELERQQVPSKPEIGFAHPDETQQASPETGASTFIGVEQHNPVGEETIPLEAKVATNEEAEGSEVAVVQDNETVTEPAPTTTTPTKAPAQKSVTTRKRRKKQHRLLRNDLPVVAKVPGNHTQVLSKREPPSWKSPNKQSTCWQRWR